MPSVSSAFGPLCGGNSFNRCRSGAQAIYKKIAVKSPGRRQRPKKQKQKSRSNDRLLLFLIK
ncbi:hypothetical protein HYN48_03480 [Flavobacterium magnum]|uniref:Uncharacterized protein n=1 Tax=Flavobacterium magnum TaxID=2162713 RepID=A0A2S0RET1_9FLAO|nr:hypothetical protein HYN48_03480 [Flavobacterium magnum]